MATVLLVDDDHGVRTMLQVVLDTAGFEVAAHDNGSAAVRDALERVPDVAVLDVSMPGMSGLDVCRELRADPRTAQLPIVLLTALGQWLDVASGFEAGADDYVVKPFSPRDLLQRIEQLLGQA
ncbi:response regulator [Dactylosporangium sp. NPDC000244]|uniref:response regulator transcription factor n=1 Tax=Dactylosporangium sp. NPDC000244 TaxID=3154365 RepID=UPI003322307B